MSMPPPGATPAAWYPDPTGRHQLRWYDGSVWTEHVSDNSVTSSDPLTTGAPVTLPSATPERIADQVSGVGMRSAGVGTTASGGGTVFSEPVLVVNQKAKVIELTNQYAVFNRDGTQVASVTQVGQSAAKKVLRALTSLDQFMTHRLEVRDMAGGLILGITRPAKLIKSTVVVNDASGGEVGRIVQENMIGKIHFALEAGGQRVGSIHAENWRAWNFSIRDASGQEVARITKTFEGIAKTLFTTADNYVVQLHTSIAQPLLTLVVASALSVDTALKQDSRGLG